MNTKEYNNCVKQHSDALYRFAIQYISDTAAAEDVVQDSFVQLWQQCDRLTQEEAKAYLFTVTRNQLVSIYRHEEVRRRYAESLPENDRHESGYRQMEMQDVLRKTLSRIPEVQKEVLLLRDWEGFAYKEIAEITQLSEQQVMVYLFRARTAMRKHLEAEGYHFKASSLTKKQSKDEIDN